MTSPSENLREIIAMIGEEDINVILNGAYQVDACSKADEDYRSMRTISIPCYGTNNNNVITATSIKSSQIVSDLLTLSPDHLAGLVASDTSSTSPVTSPGATGCSEGDLDGEGEASGITAQYRADGGRYSITITGQRTRNTAALVLGLHKPYFSLTSPVHEVLSSRSVPQLDDEYWQQHLQYASLHTSYEAQPPLPHFAVPNNSDQSDRDRTGDRRPSASVNPMSIIIFLTNLYLRFRRLFEMKNSSSGRSTPGSNPGSPVKHSQWPEQEVAPRVFYSTFQDPQTERRDNNGNSFFVERNTAQNAEIGNPRLEDTVSARNFNAATSSGGCVCGRRAAALGNSNSYCNNSANGMCVCSGERVQAESTLGYLHQAHRRYNVQNIEPDSILQRRRTDAYSHLHTHLHSHSHSHSHSHTLTSTFANSNTYSNTYTNTKTKMNTNTNTTTQTNADVLHVGRVNQPVRNDLDMDAHRNGFRKTTSRTSEIYLSSLNTTTASIGTDYNGKRGGSRTTTVATSSYPYRQPVKSKSIDRAPTVAPESMIKTWPPLQRKVCSCVEDDMDDDFGLFDELHKQSSQIEFEFNIPHRDIKFVEQVSQGVREAIYRGHWHGAVWVHTYWNLTHSETKRFWEEVSRLSMIRHENVALFMGASMEPPRFAIVSTLRKYPSLHEKLHLTRDTLSQRTKVSITKQIAQAVSYLHAKKILVKRLHSGMVYLDPKVKLYMVNLCLDDPDGHAVIRRKDLPYIAPEILRAVRIEPHIPYLRVPDSLFTAESDAYAFGTLLYEIFSARYPFEKLEMEAFVWCICTGKRENIDSLNSSDVIRGIVQDCWSHDALCRPELSEINSMMSQPGVLKKRCSSDPERLNELGLFKPF